jgi:hypothetical protein
MQEMLRGGTFRLDPAWYTERDFLALLETPDGVDGETAERWAQRSAVMDPARDVALLLMSGTDATGA